MRKNFIKQLGILLAVMLLAGSISGALADLKEADGNFLLNTDPAYEKIIEGVQQAVRSHRCRGAVLIATDDEIILFSGPGGVVTRAGDPVDLYTVYDIASCSKLFTAVAVFQLIEAGRISPDDTIDRFFPGYEAGKGIKVWHLLHMQSGIPDYVNDPLSFWTSVSEEEMDQFMARLFRDDVTDEELLESLYAAPLLFNPGSRYSYSNTNYHLLAMIVEQVSGLKFCDYLKENIFDACGMEHTTAMVTGNETSVPEGTEELIAFGVVDENGYSMSPNLERGDGGIHTCAADLWAFDKALLSGRLVSSSSLDEMRSFDKGYGCGLMLYGKDAYGHSGSFGTYVTENVIIETEAFGNVYYLSFTADPDSPYGFQTVRKALFAALK